MVQSYDPNFQGTHVIRVTFMMWKYVGHIAYKIGGNCMGGSLLESDFLENETQDNIKHYVENDCNFRFDDEEEIFYATLKDEDGNELDVEGDDIEFRNMIVNIEIADTIPETPDADK